MQGFSYFWETNKIIMNNYQLGNLIFKINRTGAIHLPDTGFGLIIYAIDSFKALCLPAGEKEPQASRYIEVKRADISPVPFTEFYYRKFDFVKSFYDDKNEAEGYYFEKKIPIIGDICTSDICTSDKRGYIFDCETDTLRIKYVHQYQNLISGLLEQIIKI